MNKHGELAGEIKRLAPRRRFLPVTVVCVLLVGVLAAGHTPRGALVVAQIRAFLEFYAGVFVLLTLTATVVAGLVTTGQVVPVRLRILAQSAHRAAAVMAVSFLAAHVLLKVLERHATVIDAVLPFSAGRHGHALYVGLGTIAGDLMILVLATGVARGRFIGSARPWTWRMLHSVAYLSWPIAIVHGLAAGRAPKPWVTWSYVICFGLVLTGVTVRLLVSVFRRKGTVRRGGARVRPPAAPVDQPAEDAIPDDEFWSGLKSETSQWIGGRL
jgi:DMSO/TMAO reductase YedYZ heme-binding membrane subunit